MQNSRKPADSDVKQFIESLPSPDEIRDRIARNAHENSVLKRILKLSVAAHQKPEASNAG
jgi:hypothetical protein